MMDVLKQILADHFDKILYTTIGLVTLAVALTIKLFHELRTDTEKTRKALRTLRGLVAIFKPSVLPEPGKPDPLAETTAMRKVEPLKRKGE